MTITLDQSPDDVDALKPLVADQLARNAQLESRVVVQRNRLTHVGCLAHARRRFRDAVKAQGKMKKAGMPWR